MPIISLMNQKGGVGKTTTTINLAAQSAIKNRTLMVDVDNQANLTKQFLSEEPEKTVEELFHGRYLEPIEIKKNLFLLPSSLELTGIENKIADKISREFFLKKALKKYQEEFDNIFIDCPPNVNLVTINALTASDHIICPIIADAFSVEGIEGMISVCSLLKEQVNPDLNILGIVVTQYDERLSISKHILKDLEDRGWADDIFKTKVRVNTAIRQGQYYRKDIFQYDRKSHGAMDYAKLGQEVMKRINNYQKL
ncbi:MULTISPECIES: ParA family protein [Flavobacteriaceae]|uniref:ParA family protein n=1 Tax=Flavobacteriaceae TaxID=49546 RepID=UPI0010AE142A|nr:MULTISPECIES: ParA family protein [Flavobacteriaceae]NJB38134.1 AAA family ATPase [Croceivirga sp. JEA036]TKD58990.1 ParA family protein [Flavobacterium sp. ASW18X]